MKFIETHDWNSQIYCTNCSSGNYEHIWTNDVNNNLLHCKTCKTYIWVVNIIMAMVLVITIHVL